MKEYNPHEIEPRWQAVWEENGQNVIAEDSSRPKKYVLEMFPYPSGDPHMGHARNYSIGDVIARYSKMRGYDVLHPMGWDAFGLPAENAAIKHNGHPATWTYGNIETQRNVFKRMGFSYDWDRTVRTCDKEYYRWGQWIFLKMWEKGLVERRSNPVNWCESCHTVLANEQVTDGVCWRCGNAVERRELEQWYFKITEYAQELLDDLDKLDGWPERVKQMQANWIGRSEGAEVDFALCDADGNPMEGHDITVFTTRPDTLFGCSFFLLAPEYDGLIELVEGTEYEAAVREVMEGAEKVTAVERAQGELEKHGAFTGRYVVNPINGKKVPVWLPTISWPIMAQAQSWLFRAAINATSNSLASTASLFSHHSPERGRVVRAAQRPAGYGGRKRRLGAVLRSYGLSGASGKYTGMEGGEHSPAVDSMIADLEAQGKGKLSVQFRLRDWLMSRQRYWGNPIPAIYCDECGIVPVPEEDLQVELPLDLDITKGEQLANNAEFVECTCPKCGRPARRETDTMDTFTCSSWYYLRCCG